VRDVIRNDGTLVAHYRFDSFGNVLSGSTGPGITRYLFTARELDEETGLQYNRARWYDTTVGRWINEDPIGFAAGDTNLSRYVSNGPTNAIDPTGLTDYIPWNDLELDAVVEYWKNEDGSMNWDLVPWDVLTDEVAIYDKNDSDALVGQKSAEGSDTFFSDNSFGAASLGEAIGFLREYVRTNGKLDSLKIIDHGNPKDGQLFGGTPGLGDGFIITPADWAAIGTLMDVKSGSAVINLLGCNVAMNDEYGQMVADTTGVIVLASTGLVFHGVPWYLGDQFDRYYTTGEWKWYIPTGKELRTHSLSNYPL
jgi:RHS repeat-associated protein